MSLWKKIVGELVDVIEHADEAQHTLLQRFERYDNEIKYGAQLIVREGQEAIFVNEGKLAEVFKPGRYVLQTENLPILSTLLGWKHGFHSPFKAEIYFVSTRVFLNQGWGTQRALTLNDPKFGLVDIRAHGTFAYKVVDSAQFLRELVGAQQQATTAILQGQLRSLIVSRFSDALALLQIGVEQLIGQLQALSDMLLPAIDSDIKRYGVEITQFVIENLSLPDTLKEEIAEYSRLNRIDLDRLMKLKTAKAIENISLKEGSAMSQLGADLGVGLAVAHQMANAIALLAAPLGPGEEYYLALDNQQQGPFSSSMLTTLAHNRQLTADTLAWKPGMSEWTRAGNIAALQSILSLVPPPLAS